MTSFELMEAMGTIRDKYVLEAHSGEAEAKKRRPTRRALLIAAIISLMLLLLGCAAVLLGLGELKLTREPVSFNESGFVDTLSLQGYCGTPNYQASKEWREFLQSYDQDGKLLEEASQGNCSFDPAGISMDYVSYECYTMEMKDKIDEICEKYGLEILGPLYWTDDDSPESVGRALRELGVENLLLEDAEADTELYSMYYFREGSFDISIDFRLTAPGNPWPYLTRAGYRSVMKTSFDGVTISVDNIDDFDQWTYTIKDGTEVLLARSEAGGLIFADRENHFVTINIPAFSGDQPEGVNMSRAALEAIADIFTFDYTPHRPDPNTLVLSDKYLPATEGVPEPSQEPAMEEIQRIINSFRETYPEKTLKYTLHDFDQDWNDDLAIWYDGAYRALYLLGEGYDSPREYQFDSGFQIYETYLQMELNVRYQGEILGTVETVDGVEYHNYYVRGSGMHWWDTVKRDGDQYYRGIPGSWDIPYDTPVETWEPITQEEYDEILESYLPQPVELRGVASSEDKAAVQQSFTAILEGSGTFFADLVNSDGETTLARYCETFTEDLAATLTEFTLVDFERDGIPELVFRIALGENTDCGVLVLHWEEGEAWGYTFSNRQMQEIKSDGTFYWSGSSSNHGVARISFSKGEYIRRDILWVEEIDSVGRYFYGDTEISSDRFSERSDRFFAKEEPQWVDYPAREYADLWKGFEGEA